MKGPIRVRSFLYLPEVDAYLALTEIGDTLQKTTFNIWRIAGDIYRYKLASENGFLYLKKFDENGKLVAKYRVYWNDLICRHGEVNLMCSLDISSFPFAKREVKVKKSQANNRGLASDFFNLLAVLINKITHSK